MNRRDILRWLGLSSGTSVVGLSLELPVKAAYTQPLSSVESPQEIDGYRVWWKPWLPTRDFDYFIAQWVANPLDKSDRISYYASYPGGEGWYFPCAMLDTGLRVGQTPVTDPSSPEAEQARIECYHRLIRVLAKRERPIGYK